MCPAVPTIRERTPPRIHSGLVARPNGGPARHAAEAALALGAALAVTWVLYAGALHGPFVFDDVVLASDPVYHPRTLGELGGILSAPGHPRKLAGLTFGLNHVLGGLDPYGYHVGNVLLHALNGALLFLLATRLLRRLPEGDPRRLQATPIAGAAALLWLVHPVQSQAVAYVWQRSTLLAAAFSLMSLLGYVEGRVREGGRRLAWYAAAAAAGVLALFCKENAATLPLLVLLLEAAFFHEGELRPRGRTAAAGVALAAVFAVVAAVYLGRHFLTNIQADYVRRGFTMSERVLTELRVVVHYGTLLALPHPSRLHLDYDFPLSRGLLHPPATLLSLLALGALAARGVHQWRRDRLLSAATFWFLGNLVIESSVIPLDLVYEHRLYLPSMLPVLWVTAALLTRVLTTPARQALLAIPLVLGAAWTIQRAHVWGDPVRLFADNAEKAPGKARSHWKLGRAYMDAGDLPAARASLQRALELDPDTIEVYNNLAAVHLRLGDAAAARDLLEEALRRGPGETERWALCANLGNAYMALRQPARAVGAFEDAMAGPPAPLLHRKLALAQIAARDFDGARRTLRDAALRWPQDESVRTLQADAEGWMARGGAPSPGSATPPGS
jgi:Flp pilus assembly protein TadD